jgi:hypothetical protein
VCECVCGCARVYLVAGPTVGPWYFFVLLFLHAALQAASVVASRVGDPIPRSATSRAAEASDAARGHQCPAHIHVRASVFVGNAVVIRGGDQCLDGIHGSWWLCACRSAVWRDSPCHPLPFSLSFCRARSSSLSGYTMACKLLASCKLLKSLGLVYAASGGGSLRLC